MNCVIKFSTQHHSPHGLLTTTMNLGPLQKKPHFSCRADLVVDQQNLCFRGLNFSLRCIFVKNPSNVKTRLDNGLQSRRWPTITSSGNLQYAKCPVQPIEKLLSLVANTCTTKTWSCRRKFWTVYKLPVIRCISQTIYSRHLYLIVVHVSLQIADLDQL